MKKEGAAMKKRMISAILVVITFSAMLACAQSEEKNKEGTEWVKDAIQKFNESDLIQMKEILEETKEDGSTDITINEEVLDKKGKQVYIKTTVSNTEGGEWEAENYFVFENGKTCQLSKQEADRSWMKQVNGGEELINMYLDMEKIRFQDNMDIEIMGEEEIDGKQYTKVKLTTSDYKRLKERQDINMMYDEAVKSKKYKEEIQKAEKEYQNSKDTIIVWFNKDREPIMTESDSTLKNRFVNAVMCGYLDMTAGDVSSVEVIQKSVQRKELISGEQCEKIEIPTEYEWVEE